MMTPFKQLGFVRTAVSSPALRVADIDFNTGKIIESIERAVEKKTDIIVFPELAITGYTCADLFYQSLLLEQAFSALPRIAETTVGKGIAVIVGLPVMEGGRIYNTAAFIHNGLLLGIVPKSFLSNAREFYEERWFSTDSERNEDYLSFEGEDIPFGADLLFRAEDFPGLIIGIEICEDLWTVAPPSNSMSSAGATVICNLSASNEILGKAAYRRDLVLNQSARCIAAYLYAASGASESTSDLTYSGHCMIAEDGTLMKETERFRFDTQTEYFDIDIDHLVLDRGRNSTYANSRSLRSYRIINFRYDEGNSVKSSPKDKPERFIDPKPFIPDDSGRRNETAQEIMAIQRTGLAKRLLHIGTKKAVIGLSGGLDSTLAFLVTLNTFDLLNLDRSGIIAVTMPGFGTSEKTKSNAVLLAEKTGVALRTIDITDAVKQHFKDIDHPEDQYDVTFENAQARERTQILMDIANQTGGLVIGTGDLSELALGWCTYNADQMSMYNVNAGVPKTLVRFIIEYCAEAEFCKNISDILKDIVSTTISPELLPPGKDGKEIQDTESIIGPYILHDFFLYNMVRMNYSPKKIFTLAVLAFDGTYKPAEILKWLKVFYKRFFTQQFKRNPMPDGPKVGSVALSPRGDWRMPSDAAYALWMKQLDNIKPDE
jgi:NAD+ synthase (glutamine-hydrolysing)